MNVTLRKAELADAEQLWKLQIEGFAELLERYQDFDTNPAAEPLEKTIMRLQQPWRHFYFVMEGNTPVGAISVRVLDEGWKKLGPLWVQPAWRGKGIARRPSGRWRRSTAAESGCWTLFCKRRATATCMRRWATGRRARPMW